MAELEEMKKGALDRAAGFIEKSIDVHNGKGSSHSYSFWLNPDKGWHRAYPETTGYLLETLINFRHTYENFGPLGRSCAEWLVEIQNEDGSFHAGVYRQLGPSVFNTAVIAQGLLKAHHIWGDFGTPIEKAYDWLMNQQSRDGGFNHHGYQENNFPTYYTRVAWSMIDAGIMMGNNRLLQSGEKCLELLLPRFKGPNIKDCGFKKGETPFLHTVAYAIRGLLESQLLLQRKNPLVDHWLEYFDQLYKAHNSWPGSCWPDNFNFRCNTGEAQLALCYKRAHHAFSGSEALESRLMTIQKSNGQANGGIPGSTPFWGPYMTLKYPNWGVKFFMDLLG